MIRGEVQILNKAIPTLISPVTPEFIMMDSVVEQHSFGRAVRVFPGKDTGSNPVPVFDGLAQYRLFVRYLRSFMNDAVNRGSFVIQLARIVRPGGKAAGSNPAISPG